MDDLTMHAELSEIARYCAESLLARIENRAGGADRPLSEQMARQQKLCQDLLEVLDGGVFAEEDPSIHFHYDCVSERASEDEEWWEITTFWKLTVRRNRVELMSYENLATIVGAGQNKLFRVLSHDAATVQNLARARHWRQSLEEALEQKAVHQGCRYLSKKMSDLLN